MEKSGEAAKIFDKWLGAAHQLQPAPQFKIEPIKG